MNRPAKHEWLDGVREGPHKKFNSSYFTTSQPKLEFVGTKVASYVIHRRLLQRRPIGLDHDG